LKKVSSDGLDGESFEIPDLTTSDVHPNGPPARVQRNSFHQQLVFGEDRVARVARFAVAWSTPDRSDAVMRQETFLEFATDEEVESFSVDTASRVNHARGSQIHLGLDVGASTLEAGVQAGGG
jgi:hypothetical protein